ncbi:MAG TPA: tetratricopeptide repeat protein [Gemmataceae bacterium]|nr:tetratricopeptide repeat protein [Gemmataceae bacterium]
MREPRLVTYFREIPDPSPTETPEEWTQRLRTGLEKYRRQISDVYTEATLERLMCSYDPICRRAAVLALGLVGTMATGGMLSHRLYDDDPIVRQLAGDALWAVWFRAAGREHCERLQQIVGGSNARTVLRDLDVLISRTGDYAEAYNQRAICYYRLGEFRRAAADCEAVLKLNPQHFGAAAGMAQCYLKLNRPRAALHAFRTALEINPNLDDVDQAVKALEEMLGENAEGV